MKLPRENQSLAPKKEPDELPSGDRFSVVLSGIISVSGQENSLQRGCVEFGHFPAVCCCIR